MRLAWLTDIHLNFLGTAQISTFIDELAQGCPDALLITGDIGESHTFALYLLRIADRLKCPVYFVLGNHDFYYSGVEHIRNAVRTLCDREQHVIWLPLADVVELAPGVALVGHDGWADGRLGDFENSQIVLNDYFFIQELADLPKMELQRRLNTLGDEAADHFRKVLPQALARFRRVFVATHVPPFKEACRYNGSISDDNALPHFACGAVGDVLLELARQYPETEMIVLCGHTHMEADVQMADNLRVLAGGVEYGAPVVQQTFELA